MPKQPTNVPAFRDSSVGTGGSEEKHSVTASAAIFLVGTLLSRILGLYRDILIARYLSENVRDAFLNAFRLPNLFRRLFGEGGLAASFVPVHTELTRKERLEQAAELRSGVFSILFSFTVTVSLLLILFMDDVMGFLLSGSSYMNVQGKFELTVKLARIMFAFFIMVSLFGYLAAVLNSARRFAMVAFAPCVFNIVIVLMAKISRGAPAPELALAWAVMIGGFLQMALLIPAVWRLGQLPRWTWNWRTEVVGRVLKMTLPSLFSLAIPQIVLLVNMRFASSLASGAHSYLYLAERLLELPLSLFVVSMASTLLPTLSSQWAAGERAAMRDTINHIIRLVVFIAFPAALGLFVLAQPICEILFLGREFKYSDVLATASIVRIYSLALIFWACVRILTQGFHAIQNPWYPAVAGGVALIAHIIFAFTLTRVFRLEGLAVASVASAFVHLLMLGLAYHSWVGSLELKRFARSCVKFAACGAILVLLVQFHGPIQKLLSGRFRGGRELALCLTILVGAGGYFLSAYALRIVEFRETWDSFSRKIRGLLDTK